MHGQIDPFWPAGARQLMFALTSLVKDRGEELTCANILRLLEAHPTFESLNEIAEFTSDDASKCLCVFKSGHAEQYFASFVKIISAVLTPMNEAIRL